MTKDFVSGWYENPWLTSSAGSPANVVTYDIATGAFSANALVISAFNEYLWADFILLDASQFVDTPVLITDKYQDLGSRAGVMVIGSSTGKWSMLSPYLVTTWAAKPSAVTYPGWRILVTDFGLRPSKWTSDDNATAANNDWFADSTFLLGVSKDIALPAAFTTENIMAYLSIPSTGSADGSAYKNGDVIRITEAAGKTGTTNAMTLTTRAGINHTTGDTSIASVTPGVSVISWGVQFDFERLSATSIRLQGMAATLTSGSYSGTSTTAIAADITGLTNIDTGGATYYISSGMVLNGVVDTSPILKNWRAEFIPAGV